MSLENRKRAGLGRGLSALLGDVPTVVGEAGSVTQVAIARIAPDPDQPRQHFNEAALAELADSIGRHGVLQPILIRPDGGGYRIVAGERRWRAAQQAQLHEIPAVVRTFEEASALEAAIVENIQRQDLNAIEEARAYRRLLVEFDYTQDQLAQRVHKSRSHVANLIRMLDLPDDVQAAVMTGALSMGHARAVATSPDPSGLAAEIVRRGLSVRDAEKLGKGARPSTRKVGTEPAALPPADADVAALERHLRDLLGLDVRIDHADRSGKVTLTYASLEQLDLICQRLTGDRI